MDLIVTAFPTNLILYAHFMERMLITVASGVFPKDQQTFFLGKRANISVDECCVNSYSVFTECIEQIYGCVSVFNCVNDLIFIYSVSMHGRDEKTYHKRALKFKSIFLIQVTVYFNSR